MFATLLLKCLVSWLKFHYALFVKEVSFGWLQGGVVMHSKPSRFESSLDQIWVSIFRLLNEKPPSPF
jgi:hypothetical protein